MDMPADDFRKPVEDYIHDVDTQTSRFIRIIMFICLIVFPALIILGTAFAVFVLSNELPR